MIFSTVPPSIVLSPSRRRISNNTKASSPDTRYKTTDNVSLYRVTSTADNSTSCVRGVPTIIPPKESGPNRPSPKREKSAASKRRQKNPLRFWSKISNKMQCSSNRWLRISKNLRKTLRISKTRIRRGALKIIMSLR